MTEEKTGAEEHSNCSYDLGMKINRSPHHHEEFKEFEGPNSVVMDTILDAIGYTPMVRLKNIAQSAGLECDLLAKCEYFNAGGSVKDRIGKRMVLDAEKTGRIKPGDVLIEPTSGNTGIGLALAAAIRGYRMIVTLPEKMSNEKVNVLKALGAQIIRTPTEAAFDSPESHIGVAKRLNSEIPNSHILDQYSNPSNPMAHFDGTAEEILAQCGGQVDMIVCGAGTGGTITGIAAKVKSRCPNCIIVGADPMGSILAQPESLNGEVSSYHVEGIGYDFIPKVLHRKYIDQWIKTEDQESFLMARRLIREEGLLCGGSSGTAVVAALKAAQTLRKGQKCVVLLPDSVRNYMTKFLSDDWMLERGYISQLTDDSSEPPSEKMWWWSRSVSELQFQTPVTVSPMVSCQKTIDILNKTGFDQLPVINESSDKILGVVTLGRLMSKITRGQLAGDDPVSEAMFSQFQTVSLQTSLAELSQKLNKSHFCLIVAQQAIFIDSEETVNKQVIVGVLTRIDLLNYITRMKTLSRQNTPREDVEIVD